MCTNGPQVSCEHARCHSYPIPRPVKAGHTTGVYDPCSFRIVMWVLLRRTRTNQWKCCETGLSCQLFKHPECCSGRGLNSRPPAQKTGALSTEPTSYVKLFLVISLNAFLGGNRDAGLISPFTNQLNAYGWAIDMSCQTGWTTMNMFVRGRVLPYMGYTGMCRWTGYGFWPLYSKQGIYFRPGLS